MVILIRYCLGWVFMVVGLYLFWVVLWCWLFVRCVIRLRLLFWVCLRFWLLIYSGRKGSFMLRVICWLW